MQLNAYIALLGMLLAPARSSEIKALRASAGAYTSLFRNTPLLVQLLFCYFGVPASSRKWKMDW